MYQVLTKTKKHIVHIGALLGVGVLFGFGLNLGINDTSAAVGINQQLNYQGKITDSSNTIITNDDWNFRFRLYDSSTGGNLLWTERWTSTSTQVTTVNGIFSIQLGSLNSLSGVDFNSDSLYLQVDFDADANGSWEESFSTRKRITSSAYAFNSDTVDGLNATSTAAVANYLVALDAQANLDLFGQGVSSTRATTTQLYVSQDARINNLHASSTDLDSLQVNGSATTTGILEVSQYATTTGGLFTQGNLHIGGTASFDGLISGAGFDNAWNSAFNSTTTWSGFSNLWNNLYNATTTLNGFTPDDYLLTSTFLSTTTWNGDLTVGGNATTSGWFNIGTTDLTGTIPGLFGAGDLYVGNNATITTTLHAPEVCIANDCRTAWPSGGGANDWQFGGTSDYITPTSSVGLIVNASSTFIGDFRVDGSATTTGILEVSQYATTTGGLFTQGNLHSGGTASFDGNTLIGGNLGIGTTNPFGVLHAVDLEATAYNDADANGQELAGVTLAAQNTSSGADSFAQILLRNRSSAVGDVRLVSILQGGNHSDFAIVTENGTSASEKLRVTGDGFIGLSTSTPNAFLTLEGQNGTNNILQVATTTKQDIFLINNDGYIGVGTSSPTSILTVEGKSSSSATGLRVYVGSTDPIAIFENVQNSSFADGVKINVHNSASAANSEGLLIVNEGGDSRFLVDADGNVGIGNSAPGSLLTIGSAEIFTVDSSGNASTSGYLNIGVSNNGLSLNAGDLFVGNNATITTTLHAPEVCIANDCRTAWPTGGGANDWQFGGTSDYITPTSSVGLIVNASSTFIGDFRVGDNATITNHFSADSGTLTVRDSKVNIGSVTNSSGVLNVEGSSASFFRRDNSGLSALIAYQNYDTTAGNGVSFIFQTVDNSADLDNVGALGITNMQRTATGVSGDLFFATTDDGNSYTEKVRITAEGNFGIGTSSPAFLLQTGSIGAGTYFSADSSGNATTSGRLVVGTTAPALDGLIGAGDLFVGNNATITTTLHAPEVCIANDCRTAWPTGDGANDWQFGGTSDYITPTSSVGLIVNASSTFIGGFNIDGAATTTGKLNVGNGISGDSILELMIGGVAKWTLGADDDENDNFVISSGGTLGTNNAFSLDSSGNATTSGWFNIGATNGISDLLNSGDLYVGNNATITTTLHAPEVCIANDCRTAWPSGGGANDWQFGGTSDYITPTSSVGLIITASSTFSGGLSIDSNATTSGSFRIGTDGTIRRADIATENSLFVADDIEINSGGYLYANTWSWTQNYVGQSIQIGNGNGGKLEIANYNSTDQYLTILGGAGSDAGYVGVATRTPSFLFQIGDVSSDTYFSTDASGNATTTGRLVVGTTFPPNLIGSGDLFVGNNATITTTLHAPEICIDNDCRTSWPVGGGGGGSGIGWSWNDINLLYNTTSTDDIALGASSTSTAGLNAKLNVFGLTYTQGLISTASSTIIGGFRVDGDATTTGQFNIGDTGGSGDSVIELTVSDSSVWTFGADDDENDNFVISSGGTLGTNNVFSLDSSGNATTSGWLNLGATNGIAALLNSGDLYVGGNATTTNHFTADDTLFVKDSLVGIGLNSPVALLHVQSSSAGTISPGVGGDDFIIENGSSAGMTIYSPDANASSIYLASASDDIGAQITWNHDNNLMRIGTHNAGDSLAFETAVASEAMRIDSNGQVGIGDSSPAELFTVGNGDLFTIDSSGNASTTGYLNIGVANGGLALNSGDLFVGNNATITTTLHAPEICIDNDCRTSWPTGGGGGGSGIGWSWNDINLLYNTTSTDDIALGASSTSTAGLNAKLNVFGLTYTQGLISTASSTIIGDFRVDGNSTFTGNATTSGWFNIGNTDLTGTIPGLFGAGDLFVGNNATITNTLHASEICIANDCQTSWPSGGGVNDWQFGGTSEYITPTTSVGLLITASSTFTGGLVIGGDATTTGQFNVGSGSGDSVIELAVSGSPTWTIGADDDENDNFVISSGGTLGTNNVFSLDSSGNATTSGWLNLGATNGIAALLNSGDLYVGNNATITTTLHAPEICIANDCQTSWPSGGGISDWQFGGTSDYITPTTSVGLIITASSTFTGGLNITGGSIFNGAATTTGQFNVGTEEAGDSILEFTISGAPTWSIGADDDENDNFVISSGGTLGTNNAFSLDSSGNATTTGWLNLGASNGVSELLNSGDLYVGGNATITGSLTLPNIETVAGTAVHVDANGRITKDSSSLRYKENVDYNGVNGDLLYDLQPASFTEKSTGNEYIGFIAEDVAKIDPRLVVYDNQGRPNALYYDKFTSLITKAVQDQKILIDQILNNQVSTSSAPLIVTEADVTTETLVVQEAATFYGTLYVVGEAGFEHQVTFHNDIAVEGKIYASGDTAGTAVIEANATSTEVIFEEEYKNIPKVVANMADDDEDLFINWKIINKSTTGFRILIQEPVDQDISFDWIALGSSSDIASAQGITPVIDSLTSSREIVGFDVVAEFWAQVTDNDSESEEITYTWTTSPNIGQFSSQEGITTWKVSSGEVEEDTTVTVTVTVSDGYSETSESIEIEVEASSSTSPDDQEEETPAEEEETPEEILGCTDEAATNYNDQATQDNDSCEYEEEVATEEPVSDQEEVATQDEEVNTSTQ